MTRNYLQLVGALWVALAPASAQDIFAGIDWDKLAAKASEKVNINLDSSMLKLASQFMSENDPEQAKVRTLAGELTGIWVRSLKFDKAGEYNLADIEKALESITSPAWKKVVDVSEKDERAGVYLKSDGNKIQGVVVVAAEPKELTVVNIVGAIDPDKVKLLGGNFGIPKMEMEMKSRSQSPKKK